MAKKSEMARGPYKSSEDPEKFGRGGIKLRQWRLFHQMTVAGLAEAADLSVGTITGIEGGKSGWGPATLVKLADALGTSPAGLLGINPLEDPAFWEVWTQASDPERQRIADYSLGVVQPRKPGGRK